MVSQRNTVGRKGRVVGSALVALLLLFAGCAQGPCQNGGKRVDTRPLPASWAKLLPPLPQQTAFCVRGAAAVEGARFTRHVHIPRVDSQQATTVVRRWVASGKAAWRFDAEETRRAQASGPSFEHAVVVAPGHRLHVKCTRKLPFGWCTLAFSRR